MFQRAAKRGEHQHLFAAALTQEFEEPFVLRRAVDAPGLVDQGPRRRVVAGDVLQRLGQRAGMAAGGQQQGAELPPPQRWQFCACRRCFFRGERNVFVDGRNHYRFLFLVGDQMRAADRAQRRPSPPQVAVQHLVQGGLVAVRAGPESSEHSEPAGPSAPGCACCGPSPRPAAIAAARGSAGRADFPAGRTAA